MPRCRAALLDGKNGIKDLDVWSFYRAVPERPYPYRRRGVVDFGDPKFGRSATNGEFVGRRVELLGRSIDAPNFSDPVAVLRDYLASRKTESARLLARKAVVLIEPANLLGAAVWSTDAAFALSETCRSTALVPTQSARSLDSPTALLGTTRARRSAADCPVLPMSSE
jgi:hypothetical protein